jgi:hypothetical protein
MHSLTQTYARRIWRLLSLASRGLPCQFAPQQMEQIVLPHSLFAMALEKRRQGVYLREAFKSCYIGLTQATRR